MTPLPGATMAFRGLEEGPDAASPRRIMARMPPATKRTAPPQDPPTPRAAAKPAKPARKSPAAAAPPPSLRFHHSEALREKTLLVLCTIEEADDATVHREALTALVIELTSSGLEGYFMQPLKRAKAGFITEQTANLGLAAMQQLMGTVTRKIVGGMQGPQLLSVCGSIRELMR